MKTISTLTATCVAVMGMGFMSATSAQTGDWAFCAAEGNVCQVSGEAVVRFGIDGSYAYRNVAGPVMCNTDTFGDPARGERKHCAVSRSGNASGRGNASNNGGNNHNTNPWGNPTHGGWQTCAEEGGVCNFRGSRNVRYGVPGNYISGHTSNGVECSNRAFGTDPAPGTRKHCQVADEGGHSGGNNRPSWNQEERGGHWQLCAEEGDVCRVPREATVRFGVNGQYAHAANVQQRIPCTVEVFGDPARGEHKRCEYTVPSNSNRRDDSWVLCAQEGGECRVPRTTSVRFGADGAYKTIRNVTGGIACNTGTFGDPVKGTPKQCEYAR